ncbi:MAG: lipoate--protein ligase family protein [Deltaproteobacteria bacterium]|nr:lipoate--protein ligase family protein [Deltaproteobacteria bacterium]
MIWRLLNYRLHSASENMAIDEAIFQETVKHKRPPTLRFFGWQPSAVSIGYFQEVENEINFDRCRLTGVDIVRRMTGGKAVYHHSEVTYSLSAANSQKLFPNDIGGTYEVISRCLARGLSFLGIGAKLAAADVHEKREPTSRCFSVPSGNELLVEGRKICGSAQMRTHGGFLQHGSLLMKFDDAETSALIFSKQARETAEHLRRSVTAVNEVIPIPVSEETLCRALQKGFIEELGVHLAEGPLTSDEEALSELLMKKYASDAWNWRRKKE